MFASKGLTSGNDEFNIHFINSYAANVFTRGFASSPIFPSIPGAYNSCWVKTGSMPSGYDGDLQISNILAHEMGHTLGLLHTHHPGRLPSVVTNPDNATISNGCYQESVSRVSRNYWYNGCSSTDNKLKCEVNGDFLSDTNADPNVRAGGSLSSPASGCTYSVTNSNSDYSVDNWGAAWTPPTTNIMSYSTIECRTSFTTSQIGVLWYYSNLFKQAYPNALATIEGNSTVICSGTTYSVPASMISVTNYNWSASPNIAIVSGQTLSTVSVKSTASGSGKIYLDVTTPYGSFCFEKTVTVDFAVPSTPTYISIDNTTCPEFYFDVSPVSTASSYTWQYNELPSGPVTTFTTINTSSGRKVFTNGKSYRIGVKANNSCGSSGFFTTTFTVSCNGAGGHKLTYFPNPAQEKLTVEMTPIAEKYINDETPFMDEVILINQEGETVKSSLKINKKVELDIRGLKKGNYFLHVRIGKVILQEQIIIN